MKFFQFKNNSKEFDNLVKRGIELDKSGNYEEALQYFEKALNIHPNSANVLVSKANVLDNLQKPEEALSVYDRALRIDSTNEYAYYNKALCLRRCHREDEALTLCEQYQRIEPNNSSILSLKFSILYGLGRMKEARDCYYQPEQLNSDYPTDPSVFMIQKAMPEKSIEQYDQLILDRQNDEDLIGNREFALVNKNRFADKFLYDTVLENYFLEYELTGNWEIKDLENTPMFESKIAKALDNESCIIKFLQPDNKRKILRFKMDSVILVTLRKVRFVIVDLAESETNLGESEKYVP